ncbi:MAG TPA: FtsX-like permease family protein [Sphingobacteriaceae bacterium]
MNTPLFIARRYLFSKKSVNAINFISGISMLGVFVGSAALIIILSVFNGFEKLVLSMFNTLTPELLIEPATGKTFDPHQKTFQTLKSDPRVINYVEVLQEKALIRYGKSQYIGLVKGVGENFNRNNALDTTIIAGSFTLKNDTEEMAVIGSAVQAYLSVSVSDEFTDLQIFSPNKSAVSSFNPADEFIVKSIHPSGVFEVQQQFDEMTLVPLNFARDLLNEPRKISSAEISVKAGVSVDDFQEELQKKLGTSFLVKNRAEQNQLLYKILNSEKWAIFLILTFVLVIAIFNIIGSLTMLVIDKKFDIAILSGLGANNKLIRNIFFIEGMMISMIGCVVGMAVGLIFCVLQQRYGFITMGSSQMIVDAYPVAMKMQDFFLVFITVFVVSFLASSISSRLSVKHIGSLKDDL